jgi:molybdate transport repressor ModE-like protein
MAVHVNFSLSWLASSRLPPAHAATLLRLVDAVRTSGSLKQAAQTLGVSYRHAWGLLGEATGAFGAPLVELERGRGARPTALGEKLLWADRLIRDTLNPQLVQLRQEVETGLAKALPRSLPHLVIHASHDVALAELPSLCGGRVDVRVSLQRLRRMPVGPREWEMRYGGLSRGRRATARGCRRSSSRSLARCA